MTSLEPAVVVETRADCDASVIWLHGLGADGNDFVPLIPELRVPADLGVRFIFPHAPMRPVTVNGGMVMRAWFDMDLGVTGFRENQNDLRASARAVANLVETEQAHGIDPTRIVLAGFSQGGLMALYSALHMPVELAGVIALSSWLPEGEALPSLSYPLAVFFGHGNEDPLIPVARGDAARRQMEELGARVEAHRYSMAHSVCAEEVVDISRWLIPRLRA
jgi:phospholipase/carboxylesterase